jgi:cytochrome c oxidase subunit 2
VIFLVVKFRRRKDDQDEVDEPVQTHGNAKLEWAWTILPALVLIGLGVKNVTVIWDLERHDKDAINVEVRGQQWWWEYRYDTNADGKPDIITANQMVIPAGRQVVLTIRSNDVIHSYWIPALNGKKDAVPGRSNTWTLQAYKPGLYQGTCTEFCGLSHARMRMEVKAVSAADYEQWIVDQQKPAQMLSDSTPDDTSDDFLALQGQEVFKANCASCHQINGFTYNMAEENDGKPDPDYGAGEVPLTSGNAPNLTHLMSRNRFAGNMFDLYSANGTVNETVLGAWIRNPAAMKPMDPDQLRGMPDRGLSQDQIDAVVAYLSTLK